MIDTGAPLAGFESAFVGIEVYTPTNRCLPRMVFSILYVSPCLLIEISLFLIRILVLFKYMKIS